MTSGLQPPFSGAPAPVPGVTGGPAVLGGQITNDPADGNLVVAPNPGNVFQVRKGNSPQALQIYEYYHSNTDFSRIALNAQTAGPFQVSVETLPAGVVRNLQIGANGNFWTFRGDTGEFFPITDATFDIGDATHRINNLYANHIFPNPVPTRYNATGVTANPSTTSTSYVDIPDMVLNVNSTVVTDLIVMFTITMAGSVLGNGYNAALQLDAGADGNSQIFTCAVANGAQTVTCIARYTNLPAGPHTVKGRWAAQSGTLTRVGVLSNIIGLQYVV